VSDDRLERSAAARQLPLALRYPPDQRLETFIAAPEGSLAQLQSLARPAGATAVYLQGAEGVGKTHLALATCAAAEASACRAGYLPLHVARGRLVDALHALEGNDLVALDGLDAIAGDRAGEVALFDFHNRARSGGIGLLYTARIAPDQLPLVLPDLRSRLSQCARILLSPLDDAARREVLRERAQRRGLVMDDAAYDWLLRRVGRDLAGLTTLLDALDRASLAAKRRITVPFLREVLDPQR
jgi:DnaA family protein